MPAKTGLTQINIEWNHMQLKQCIKTHACTELWEYNMYLTKYIYSSYSVNIDSQIKITIYRCVYIYSLIDIFNLLWISTVFWIKVIKLFYSYFKLIKMDCKHPNIRWTMISRLSNYYKFAHGAYLHTSLIEVNNLTKIWFISNWTDLDG